MPPQRLMPLLQTFSQSSLVRILLCQDEIRNGDRGGNLEKCVNGNTAVSQVATARSARAAKAICPILLICIHIPLSHSDRPPARPPAVPAV